MRFERDELESPKPAPTARNVKPSGAFAAQRASPAREHSPAKLHLSLSVGQRRAAPVGLGVATAGLMWPGIKSVILEHRPKLPAEAGKKAHPDRALANVGYKMAALIFRGLFPAAFPCRGGPDDAAHLFRTILFSLGGLRSLWR